MLLLAHDSMNSPTSVKEFWHRSKSVDTVSACVHMYGAREVGSALFSDDKV